MDETEDKSKRVILYTTLVVVMTTLTVVLRFIGRVMQGVSLGADDWMVLLALILFYPLAAGTFVAVGYGLGKHLSDKDPESIENFYKVKQAAYWTLLLYSLDTSVTKFSILLLYQRIFPVRWLRTASWILGSIIAAWCISTFTTQIFSCTPITFYWTFMNSGVGRCIKLSKFLMSASALNTTIDVAILSLPITIVYGLQMPWKRKLLICAIFLLGGIVCVATIARTYYFSMADIDDITWSSTRPCVITVVEPGLGIICACLPTLSSIFNRAIWSRVSSLSCVRTLYARSMEKCKRSELSKQSATSNQARKADPKVDVLITLPAEAWKRRTMTAMQEAQDGFFDSAAIA